MKSNDMMIIGESVVEIVKEEKFIRKQTVPKKF